MTLVVGDTVRFNSARPDIDDEENANSPMTVSAYDAASGNTTTTRQKVPVGVFPEAELVKVPPPPDNPAPPLVPDMIPAGG
jgi:hypothetical protein